MILCNSDINFQLQEGKNHLKFSGRSLYLGGVFSFHKFHLKSGSKVTHSLHTVWQTATYSCISQSAINAVVHTSYWYQISLTRMRSLCCCSSFFSFFMYSGRVPSLSCSNCFFSCASLSWYILKYIKMAVCWAWNWQWTFFKKFNTETLCDSRTEGGQPAAPEPHAALCLVTCGSVEVKFCHYHVGVWHLQ